MTTIIGIDPGATGGCAVICDDMEPAIEVFPMPDILTFAEFIFDNKKAHVFIEKAQSFPKGGVAGMFNYGQHFGELLGVLFAYDVAHTLVPPRIWSKVMHAGTSGGDTKKRSVEAVSRLFPSVAMVPVGSKAKKPHLGMVEALLIAEYGRRTLGNVSLSA